MKSKLIIILAIVFILTATFTMAEESNNSSTVTEIEIVQNTGEEPAPAPTETPYERDEEAAKRDPFISPLEDEVQPPDYEEIPPAEPPDKDTNPEKQEEQNKDTKNEEDTAPVTAVTSPKGPEDGAHLFSYTGVLWNGSAYVGIVTSEDKSYTVKEGDKLKDYRVIHLDDKEMIVEKENKKFTVQLMEK